VEGCCHGELDLIYGAIRNDAVDLLVICGDFESIRVPADLNSMAVPPKFRKMNAFHKYFTGEKTAPVLTIIIGGNHEASNVLQSLYYGGWVAPNIYFLGFGGVVRYKGLRIAGLSGIYNDRHYRSGHFEHYPYSESTMRSVYHMRELEVYRIRHLSGDRIDIFLSHDWPQGVWDFGNKQQLLRCKPFFRDDINSGKLGNPALMPLMQQLQPVYWFAAHLHVKFDAYIPPHGVPATGECGASSGTRFLALDKAVRGRSFIEVLDMSVAVNEDTSEDLTFDVEWMTILAKTHSLLSVTSGRVDMPKQCLGMTSDDVESVRRRLIAEYGNELKIPILSLEDFAASVSASGNVQSDRLLGTLGLQHIWTQAYSQKKRAYDSAPMRESAPAEPVYDDFAQSLLQKKRMLLSDPCVSVSVSVVDLERDSTFLSGLPTSAAQSDMDANQIDIDDI
jgi:lariat debranching enzyme